MRGPASAHTCVDCGGPAAEWTYNHNEASREQEEAVKGERGHVSILRFHPDPAYYSPRCRACHTEQGRTVAHWDLETDPHLGRLAREERRRNHA